MRLTPSFRTAAGAAITVAALACVQVATAQTTKPAPARDTRTHAEGAAVAPQAFGGANAPNARAAALVDAGGAPIRTKGITAISRLDTGIYCLRPAAGIDPATAVVIVSPDYFYSELNEVQVQSAARGDCPANRIGVYTLADSNGDGIYTFSNSVGFSVLIP